MHYVFWHLFQLTLKLRSDSTTCCFLIGFGGSLVTFRNNLQSGNRAGQQLVSATVKRQPTVSCLGAISRSERFEQTVAAGDKKLLRELCVANIEACTDADDKETWSFLRVLFEEDARRQLQSHLGFSISMVMILHHHVNCFSAPSDSFLVYF